MHFLKELIDTPQLDDPAKNHMNIHRHFYRYSKGDFLGPALKIYATKNKITLKGSLEYEDLIQELVTKSTEENTIDISGILITGSDVSNEIQSLGLDWNLKKSSGKTKNYKAEFSEKIKKDTLTEIIETFRNNSYLLLSFNINSTCKVSTKKRIPQPSKKKIEDDEIEKRINFCSGTIENTDSNKKLLINLALKDFEKELPDKFKSIIITNNYKIEDIILPKGVKNSMLLRIMAIRKGKLFRTAEIDGESIEKQYNIVA